MCERGKERRLESWDDGSSMSRQGTGPRGEGWPPRVLPVGVGAEDGRKRGGDFRLPPPPFDAHRHLCDNAASEKEAPAVGPFEEETALRRMEVW